MPKPGVTVETKTETYTENGERKKKTTKTTTTVTETPDGGYKTSTKTETQIETLPKDYVDQPSVLAGGVKNLNVSDSDSSDDDDDNKMSKSDKKKFRNDCLQDINEKRKKHGACKLTKSNRLQKIAQKHANAMLKDKELSLYKGERLGQSLSMRQPRPTGKDVVDQWYSEKPEYNFSKAEFVKGAGNFTQMVWKASREIGVGVASNQDGETYIIALFDPPGNVTPQFRDNVQKD